MNNEVLITEDYTIFNRLKGNRKVDYGHVKRLKESMKAIDLRIPIIVNEHTEVVDGQHRLQARVELKLPVYYIVVPGLGIHETQKANLNNKNWTHVDFMNCYVGMNYYHYKRYKEFKEKYGFDHNTTVSLLTGTKSGVRNSDFNNGEFMITDLEEATVAAEKIWQVAPYYKGFKRRGFVFAMMTCFANAEYDHEEFLQKLEYQSSKMVDCTTVDLYLRLIEEIYNYKRRSEEKLRFL